MACPVGATTTVPPTVGENKTDYIFSDVPEHVRKLLLLDDVALYSVSPAWMTAVIIKHLLETVGRHAVITDATACVGGDTIRLCSVFKSVNAVEVSRERADMLTWNLGVMRLTNARVVCNSYVNVCTDLVQDAVYIDAPWGGPEYKSLRTVNLFLDDVPLSVVCQRVWPFTTVIALKVPKNFGMGSFSEDIMSMLPNSQIAVFGMGPAKLVVIRKKLKIE